MGEIPARRRPAASIRRLDHAAAGARLDAKLQEVSDIAREVGLGPEEIADRLAVLRSAVVASPPPRDWRRFSGLLVVAVVALALVGAWVVRPGQPAARLATTPIPPAVAGFAELVVMVYLGDAGEGAEGVLQPLVQGPVDMSGMAPGRYYVQNASAVGSEAIEGGWRVTVAAQVLSLLEGGYGERKIETYRVEILSGEPFLARNVPYQQAPG